MPWCGSAEPKVDQTPITPPQEVRESPPRKIPQISPHLQDILEEDIDEFDDLIEEEEDPGEEVCIVTSYNKYYYGKKRGGRSVLLSQSPSPTFPSHVCGRRGILRSSKSVASPATTSSEQTTPTTTKMQAEQGSIGELHKYHNRYLRNRRHTLANVR